MSKGVICQSCHKQYSHTNTALVGGKYYKSICDNCLGDSENDISGNAASYERRRGYEDYAQDTIQPYDANGKPRVEFLRLYPDSALKVYDPEVVAELKRQI